MGGEATAKHRQQALRERRRREGMKYAHFWVTPEHEQAIKAFLSETSNTALRVTPPTQTLDPETERLRGLADEALQKYTALAADAEARLKVIKAQEQTLAAHARLLPSLATQQTPPSAPLHHSDQERTQALIKRFTMHEDWRTREWRPIDEPDQIDDRVQQITKLTRHLDLVGSYNMHDLALGEQPTFPASNDVMYLRPGTSARRVLDRRSRPDTGHANSGMLLQGTNASATRGATLPGIAQAMDHRLGLPSEAQPL